MNPKLLALISFLSCTTAAHGTLLLGGFDGNQTVGTDGPAATMNDPKQSFGLAGKVDFSLSTTDALVGGFNWGGMQSASALWGTTSFVPEAETFNNNAVFATDGNMTMTFTVSNTGTGAITLETLHWISKRDVAASADEATISYVSGELSGTSATQTLGGVGTTGWDFDLGTILTDTTLSAGQSATFTWFAAGDTGSNTRLRVDNFAVSGTVVPEPTTLALTVMFGLALLRQLAPPT